MSSLKPALKQMVIFGVIILVVYFGSRAVNTWLGHRAIIATGLSHLTYQQAVERATVEDKPVLLEFSAIWCSSCRALDNNVLSDETVKAQITENYVFTRLEYESEQDKVHFESFGVAGFPTLMVLDVANKKARKLMPVYSPEELLRQL